MEDDQGKNGLDKEKLELQGEALDGAAEEAGLIPAGTPEEEGAGDSTEVFAEESANEAPMTQPVGETVFDQEPAPQPTSNSGGPTDQSMSEGVKVATVKCPNCGNDVSDQALFCSMCGAKLKEFSSAGSQAAPPATPPIPSEAAPIPAAAPSNVQTTTVPTARNKTLLMIIAAAAVVIAAIAIGFAINAQQKQAAETEAYNQYIDDLTEGMYLMLNGAAASEELCNTTVNVWNSAIFEDSRYGWDSDIRQYYADDFNTALSLLFSDQSTQNTIASIKSNQEQVNEIYRRLQNPPEGLENAYAAFEEMYDSYLTLTRLATNPTGNLQSYSNSFHEADEQCVDAFEKLQMKIPDKK